MPEEPPGSGHLLVIRVKQDLPSHGPQVLASMYCERQGEVPAVRGEDLEAHRAHPVVGVHPCYCCT